MKKKHMAWLMRDIGLLKMIKIMRFTIIILLISLTQTFAVNSYSQQTKLTLNLKNVTVERVLDEIESNSEFFFLYNKNMIDVDRIVKVNVEGQSINEVLDDLFTDTNVTYTVKDRQVMLINESAMNSGVSAQKAIKVSGKVTDISGEPLPGVTVVVKGTTNGTITNFDGVYALTAVPSDGTIQFSFVGMKTQEIAVEGKSSINITMEEDAIGIEEVVAVGYGTMKKADITGAVASVKSEDLNKTINNSFIDALAGRAAGVQVLSGEGTPGGSVSMRIRGGTSISASNEPLYVIDGFPIIDEKEQKGTEADAGTTTNVLAGINPGDIESIEILKDASATAIYGSRGANGVVIITTKSGSIGKPTISYDVYSGFKNLSKKLDVMDGVEYATYRKFMASGDPTSEIYLRYENPEAYADSAYTDWQDQVYHQAYVQNHQLSISGGSKEIKYNASLGYFSDKGIIKGSSFDRYSGRLNLKGNISKNMRFSTMLNASYTMQEGAPTGGANGTRSGVVTQALFFPPIIDAAATDPTNDIGGTSNYNPIRQLEGTILENNADRLMGNFTLEYDITPKVTFKTLVGVNTLAVKSSSYYSTNTGFGALNYGRAQITNRQTHGWINENTLTYKTKVNKHNFTLLGGYTLQGSRTDINSIVNTNFVLEDLGFNNMQMGTEPAIPTSSVDNWALMSGLARLNYNFDNRILATLSFRADGSSRFAEGNKWGFFPAAALAWRISNESFLKNSNVVSDLKLRLGFGQTGNQEVARYQALSSLGTDYYSFGVDNGSATIAVNVNRVSNPDLSWEVTQQYNAGLDLGFFKNRLTANIDAYYKKTTDLLLAVNLIPSSGIAAPALQNIGSLENRGLEVALNSVNITKKDFKWTTSFNIAFNQNKVLNLGAYDQIYVDVPGGLHTVINEVIIKPGESIGSFYGYETNGIYGYSEDMTDDEKALAGKRIVVDQNDDGIINDNDRVILGCALPVHTGGITNEFSYKSFDLSFFFNWSYGNSVYNANRIYLEEITSDPRNKSPEVLNYWTQENQDTEIPRLMNGEENRLIDRYIEDGSYIRLKNVSLGYTLPKSLISKIHLSNARVYMTAQNLVTITNYKGYNPESNVSTSPVAPGVDWAAYPLAKIYTVGLNVKF